MDMKKTMMKKGLLMSLFIGTIMGAVFTVVAQLKNMQQIIIPGLVTGILISAVLSVIIGLIIPVKPVTDKICGRFGLTPEKRLPFLLMNTLICDIIFTPLNCCVNMLVGMTMGLTDVPAEVNGFFEKMLYCIKQPFFAPALISTLIIDLLIGFVLCLFITPLINTLTDKICGINRRP